MKMYCLYDRISGKYGPLFESENDATTCRNLKLIQDPLVKACPGDFDLYSLGEKDDITGEIILCKDFVAHFTDIFGGDVNGK